MKNWWTKHIGSFALIPLLLLPSLPVSGEQFGFSDVIENAKHAVVNLSSIRPRDSDDSTLDLIEQIFDESGVESTFGSGVIVSDDGYILTNWHLTEGALRIKVNHEGTEWNAILIGEDPQTDLALIKIGGANLPFLEFGDSTQTKVGDFAFSIGNPYGIGQTVSMGIVSATQRGEGEYADYIQTDAGIHPGSSGGALINRQGKIIGINSAFLWNEYTGSQGIGFALPSCTARQVYEELRKNGFVMRSWLGAELQALTPSIGKAFGFDSSGGALVSDLVSAGPGDHAGMKRGDIIVEFNRMEVRSSHDLNLKIAQTRPGTNAEFKVYRNGKLLTLTATLKRSPSIHVNDSEPVSQEFPMNGVEVEELTSEIRTALTLPKSVHGVIVTFINKKCPAYAMGLTSADIIQEVNHKRITTTAEFDTAIRPAYQQNNVLLLLVYRNGRTKYIAVDY
jgi:serine protease Do